MANEQGRDVSFVQQNEQNLYFFSFIYLFLLNLQGFETF